MSRRYLMIAALALLPLTTVAKKADAQTEPSPTPATNGPTITYLGATYALLPDCFGTAFVVGVNQTPLGQSDTVIVAIPFTGGVSVWPPQPYPATGAFAAKSLNDAVCLQATG